MCFSGAGQRQKMAQVFSWLAGVVAVAVCSSQVSGGGLTFGGDLWVVGQLCTTFQQQLKKRICGLGSSGGCGEAPTRCGEG